MELQGARAPSPKVPSMARTTIIPFIPSLCIRDCLPAFLLALLTVTGAPVSAQELAPRAYWPTPKGTNVLALAYQYSSGDVVLDASLPLAGVESEFEVFLMSYQHTFDLWGRTTTLQVNAPYTEGTTDGLVSGQQERRDFAGLGDVRARFAINLKGAPAMDGAEFQALLRNPGNIIGASVTVQAPTGEYEEDRLINVGTNRWSVKPALGVVMPVRPDLLFEAELGVWLFGDNEEFLGQTREQEAILSSEFHLIKQIRHGLWASLDANFYIGGRTSVDGGEKINLQRNSRIGATLTVPIKGRHALRGSFSTGAVTESSGDYDVFSLTYIYGW